MEPTKSSESKDEGQDEDTKLRGQAACMQKTFEAEAHDLKQEESDQTEKKNWGQKENELRWVGQPEKNHSNN